MLRSIVLIALCFWVDGYTWPAIETAFPQTKRFRIVYWLANSLLYVLILIAILGYSRGFLPMSQISLILSIVLAIYCTKVGILIIRSLEWGGKRIQRLLQRQRPRDTDREATPISRSQFLSRTALGVASLPFMGLSYGIIWGKYDFQVRRLRIGIPHLPSAFEGFTITQISDLHMGSFDQMAAVREGIAQVNDQGSDVIFFTGDLINDLPKEVKGYESLLASLRAKEGIYSVLGNHDYAEHVPGYQTPERQQAHLDHLQSLQASWGWQLLRNDSVVLQRGEDQLAVVGVENWSTWDRFPRHGDLTRALVGTEAIPVKLLLSHDPTHWMAEVCKQSSVDITFSGHTHGCQLGVEVPGWKWSPVQYFYEEWAGLYQHMEQYLYVNRGFGFIGFSGRLGIPPEITVIELYRGPHGYAAL